MRNGNTSTTVTPYIKPLRSYRTYEEWKPNFANDNKYGNICSYRTYEEWKRDSWKHGFVFVKGSYRTYEEWKLVNITKIKKGVIEVLTVPMRNGNLR